ncbi:hypothetical protein ACFUC1_05320 [Pedococcus sp. NPDC057267]|uniref:hypothetical protein n=1 Tax=Pedococcus sp. NPDC057267 TaxID=3346077 RepID=UPI003640F23F
MRTNHIALTAAALALAGLFAAGWALSPLRAPQNSHKAGTAEPAVARTSFPGLVAASAEPRLASLGRLTPAKGQVVQAPGPFDERFSMRDLTFNGSSVSGSATITSDVSDILELEALAGFYDADGHLVGTARFTYHHDESAGHPDLSAGHTPNELEKFSIAVPANVRGDAVAAAVGVSVLVNE